VRIGRFGELEPCAMADAHGDYDIEPSRPGELWE
jgi:hypothetical protein